MFNLKTKLESTEEVKKFKDYMLKNIFTDVPSDIDNINLNVCVSDEPTDNSENGCYFCEHTKEDFIKDFDKLYNYNNNEIVTVVELIYTEGTPELLIFNYRYNDSIYDTLKATKQLTCKNFINVIDSIIKNFDEVDKIDYLLRGIIK